MSFDLSSLNVLILAGGFGTRLRSVVRDVPKPMAPVAGRPFIEHQLRFLARSGINSVVIAVGYKGDVIKQHFKKDFMGVQIEYSSEVTPLGSCLAHVDMSVSQHVGGPEDVELPSLLRDAQIGQCGRYSGFQLGGAHRRCSRVA